MRQEFVRGTRRYILSLDVDLFEACVINRHWYGETHRRHGRRQELFTDLGSASARFTAVQAYLVSRGYEPLSQPASLMIRWGGGSRALQTRR